MPAWCNKNTDRLISAILSCRKEADLKAFLRDLLTAEEIVELGKRLQVANLLAQEMPYSHIEKLTGMSSTTIARISKWLKKGLGGYQKVLSRLAKK